MVIFYILFFSATMFNGSIMVALRKRLRNEWDDEWWDEAHLYMHHNALRTYR